MSRRRKHCHRAAALGWARSVRRSPSPGVPTARRQRRGSAPRRSACRAPRFRVGSARQRPGQPDPS